MKQRIAILLVLLLLLLCGCMRKEPLQPLVEQLRQPEAELPETQESLEQLQQEPPAVNPEEIPEEVPEEAPGEIPEEPAEPEHSELYIPGVSVEDVIGWFHEVCLNAEYVMSGDPSRLQRWEDNIFYTVEGEPTDEDLQVLNGFVQWLNTVEGFPGMEETDDVLSANLAIHFCSEQEMIDRLGEQFWGNDGGVTFWYDNDIIYDAIICYRTDIAQNTRNSVILEEIYNGLGPIQDTAAREDSIIYSGFSTPQALTAVDELILRLLYHPSMACGMDAAECEAMIRTLYY